MLNKNDLKQINDVVSKNLTNLVNKEDFRKGLNPLKSDIAKIRKDIDVIIALFDREYINLRKRIEKIEEHLGLSVQ